MLGFSSGKRAKGGGTGSIPISQYPVAGDGVTDDTAALNAAISDAAGRIIDLEDKTYLTSAPLTGHVRFRAVGKRQTATIKAKAATTHNLIEVTDGTLHSLHLDGVTLDGNAANRTGAFTQAQTVAGGILAKNQTGTFLDRVAIKNTPGRAITAESCGLFRLTRWEITNAGVNQVIYQSRGINLRALTDFWVTDGVLDTCGEAGLRLDSPLRYETDNAVVGVCRNGYIARNKFRRTTQGNSQFNDTQAAGDAPAGEASVLTHGRADVDPSYLHTNIHIHENVVTEPKVVGMNLDGLLESTVCWNRITGNAVSVGAWNVGLGHDGSLQALRADGTRARGECMTVSGRDYVVHGNICNNAAGPGIGINFTKPQAANIRVSGNECWDNSLGIGLSYNEAGVVVDDLQVYGNRCWNSTAGNDQTYGIYTFAWLGTATGAWRNVVFSHNDCANNISGAIDFYIPALRDSCAQVGNTGYAAPGTTAATTLAADIASTSATTFTSAAAPALVRGDLILVDTEKMIVDLVSGTTITVVRAVDGTTAATHLSGATVTKYIGTTLTRALFGPADSSRVDGKGNFQAANGNAAFQVTGSGFATLLGEFIRLVTLGGATSYGVRNQLARSFVMQGAAGDTGTPTAIVDSISGLGADQFQWLVNGVKKASITKDGGLTLSGGVARPLVTKTGNYTVTTADDTIIANGAAVTITLPTGASAGAGRRYVVKNINAAAATVNVSGGGTIDGAASVSLPQNAVGTYVSDGANWLAV
jgi:hypothetical protein